MDNSFLIKLGLNADEISQGLSKATSQLTNFSDQIVSLGEGMGAAFAIDKIASFGAEISNLAAKAAGVKQAFSQLPDSVGLLAQMNEVTHDTVSNLDLMGKAVRAENLGIPLKDVGTLLEFAHVRAIATNQDFNELADTLLKAIGRGGAGAKKAMAELQISTEDYEEALKKTGTTIGAVMLLAQEALAKSKGQTDETHQALERLNKSWADFQVKAGSAVNSGGVVAMGLNAISDRLKIINSDTLSWSEKLLWLGGASTDLVLKIDAILSKHQAIVKSQQDWNKEMQTLQALVSGTMLKTVEISGGLETIRTVEEKIKQLKEQELNADGQELNDIQMKLEKEQLILENLQHQYDLQQDIANTKRTQNSSHTLSTTAEKGIDTQGLGGVVGQGPMSLSGNPQQNVKYIKDLGVESDDTAISVRKLSSEYIAFGNIAGAALGSALSSHESFGQALEASIPKLITQLGSLAMAYIATDALNSESNGGNYYVALGLMAAGIAIVGSLFSSLGGSVSGASTGGGGSAGSSSHYQGSSETLLRSGSSGNGAQNVTVQGIIKGKDLQLVLANQQYYDGRTVKSGG